MLGRDELDHVDSVAVCLERRSSECVGDDVRLAAEQHAVAEHSVLGPLGELAGELVMAARRDHDRLGAEPDSGGDRLVARGVAGMKGDEQVDRAVPGVRLDRGRLEPCLVVPQLLGDLAHRRDHVGVRVQADELDPRPDLAPVGDERKAHVGLAAPGVDDTDPVTLPERQRAQQLDVVLNLPLLVARDPRRREQRMALRQRVVRLTIVPVGDGRRRGRTGV